MTGQFRLIASATVKSVKMWDVYNGYIVDEKSELYRLRVILLVKI